CVHAKAVEGRVPPRLLIRVARRVGASNGRGAWQRVGMGGPFSQCRKTVRRGCAQTGPIVLKAIFECQWALPLVSKCNVAPSRIWGRLVIALRAGVLLWFGINPVARYI